MSPHAPDQTADHASLAQRIKTWGRELGFDEVGIADTELTQEAALLHQWLEKGFHGAMDYMARHEALRTTPAALVAQTLRVVSVRMNYRPATAKESWSVLEDAEAAFISRYALGRDYHKVLRQKLQLLAERIIAEVPDAAFRVFTDSAPVMEVALARKAGLGWRGKHTLLLSRDAGSYFFLGEIYLSLPLPTDAPPSEHCGSCTKCIDICPTQAITAPYSLDARRCISYLTIENKDPIPVEFRRAMGNRIYGCDDCQLVCPWNKFAQDAANPDFKVRHGLDDTTLLALWSWSEADFDRRMAGSAIRRIGYQRWRRNLAVALGNAMGAERLSASAREEIRHALLSACANESELVKEHIDWALAQSTDHD